MEQGRITATVIHILKPVKFEDNAHKVHDLYPIVVSDESGKNLSAWAMGDMGRSLHQGDKVVLVETPSIIKGARKLVVVRKLKG